MMKGPAMLSIVITVLSIQPCNRLLSDHRLRGAGEEGVSVEGDLAINLESCTTFFVARTRVTQQGHARSQFRSRRKLPKLRRGRVSRSKSSTLLCVTPHMSAFRDRGVPGPTSKLSPRAPAQMEREGGKGDGRERWKSRGLRVCPAPGSGALAVGGYKRPRGRERAASRERPSCLFPRAANPL
jgi:hypothetical protein